MTLAIEKAKALLLEKADPHSTRSQKEITDEFDRVVHQATSKPISQKKKFHFKFSFVLHEHLIYLLLFFQIFNVLARPPNLSTVWLKNICPTCNWELKKEWKFSPNNFNSFFLFWKRNIFLVFSLSPEKVLSISFLWMVAVNNRLFQKTNKQKTLGSYEKECKQTVDHMKKKFKKNQRLKYIQRRLEAVTYI